MRKLILLIFLLSLAQGKGQIERNFGATSEPVPSAASFSAFVNTPISLATGIPNISIPFFQLPTSNNNLAIPVGISYHPYNATIEKAASNVGLGWSLTNGGVISRVIKGDRDEINDDLGSLKYKRNIFDDIYYYNIPGSSGKFQFVRDTITNAFTLNNISENNVKIEFTRGINYSTLILEAFKITDSKGFKYFFNDYSIASEQYYNNYKSAFYLTKILDENDVEIATFSYQKSSKYSGNKLKYQNCNLSSISSSYGTVNFASSYDALIEIYDYSDPYQIDSVVLFDKNNRQISKYNLGFSNFSFNDDFGSRRILNRIYKVDRNGKILENRSFNYQSFVPPADDGDELKDYSNSPLLDFAILLSQITLPEGGHIDYDFEKTYLVSSADYPDADNYTLQYPQIQHYVKDDIFFNTNHSRTYSFHVDTGRSVFLAFEVVLIHKDQYHLTIHDDPETYDYALSYLLKKNGITINGNPFDNETTVYNLSEGDYTIEITGFAEGNIINTRIQTDPPPYYNYTANIGRAVNSVKYFDSNETVQKMISYNYNLFDNNSISSAKKFNDNEDQNFTILYKNVKEIYGDNTNNIGYTKYYFKTPDDYTSTVNLLKPYYNITSQGILFQKETYNGLNVKEFEENISYTMEEIPGVLEYTIGDGKSKTAWIKSVETISKSTFKNGSSLESSVKTDYNVNNFEVSKITETDADGNISEKIINYASDLGNTKLIGANMLSIPLQTQTTLNGILTGKAETKYDQSHFNPSSVGSYDLKSQSFNTEVTFEKYDDKGNLIESKSKDGIPTAIIYGYNKTQPIAKIVGSTYNEAISSTVVTAAVSASETATPEDESSLLIALENLRKSPDLKNFMITTFTWDVLVGMTSNTSPAGVRIYYKYDAAGRLDRIIDSGNQVLKKYQYNYKNNY